MGRELAVVLASGGLDSCVAAALASKEYDLALLHVNYGQRTERRELQAFHGIADHFAVRQRLVVSMEHLSLVGGSSLTDAAIPMEDADLRRSGVPSSYVPFRNAGMLAVAVSWAEALGAAAVVIGAVEEDSSGYPDCTKRFFEAFRKVIREGTKPSTAITLLTPVIDWTKAEIVRRGLAAGAPLQLTWSCYRNEIVACGVCDSCALRLRGFQQAGVDDPIPYETRPHYLTI